MNLLLCLPGQVIHANLRGADVAGFSTGIERGSHPSQICVNLLLGPCLLRDIYSVLPCLRGESFFRSLGVAALSSRTAITRQRRSLVIRGLANTTPYKTRGYIASEGPYCPQILLRRQNVNSHTSANASKTSANAVMVIMKRCQQDDSDAHS